jgi:hypothetical protein
MFSSLFNTLISHLDIAIVKFKRILPNLSEHRY